MVLRTLNTIPTADFKKFRIWRLFSQWEDHPSNIKRADVCIYCKISLPLKINFLKKKLKTSYVILLCYTSHLINVKIILSH